jgi:hypothetical protein
MSVFSIEDLVSAGGTESLPGLLKKAGNSKELQIVGLETAIKNTKIRGGKLALGAAITAGAALGLYGLFNAVRPSPHADTKYTDNTLPGDGIFSQMSNAITGSQQPTYEKMYVDVKAKSNKHIDNLNGYTQNAISGAMPIKMHGNININDNRANMQDVVNNSFGRLFE